jgi:hypothetical protein
MIGTTIAYTPVGKKKAFEGVDRGGCRQVAWLDAGRCLDDRAPAT